MFGVSLQIFLIITPLSALGVQCHGYYSNEYIRSDFPPDFIFGSGTSAYQVEGAANEDGRTPSIWDTFAHSGYYHGDDGDVACDQYHKYKEDVQLMADIGLDAYRFSISWSRLLPNGRGLMNPKGVEYYNNLINELLRYGIQPHVTLVNYDHPQALEDEYGGWVSRKMVYGFKLLEDFIVYADVCFREFGDRVQYWTTVNEPNVYSSGSYDTGITPPQRCSPPFGGVNCRQGNSSTEPYLVAHHILLAHASAVKLYRKNYQERTSLRRGELMTSFLAGKLHFLLYLQIVCRVLDPLVFGDYPKIMRKIAGSRIPSFTKLESEMVKGSFDFIGIIHYAVYKIKDNSATLMTEPRDYYADQAVKLVSERDIFSTDELPITPWGLEGVLDYLKQVYGNPPVFVYENGQLMQRNSALEDTPRLEYIQAYMGGVLNALRNGSNTKGYFTWSFLDVLELFNGYEIAYGLVYVDMDGPDLKRYPKISARWYSQFLKGQKIDLEQIIEFEENISALPS
ncbi:Glycoside hydrolase [Parasponia andersonii]|uniref:Glycoside hydrolase n=1 Tax=Parasponia andersonii TaxID=3476 RepID=A0A2P5CX92_PARAD|nr:Glycoside hydrolase [Parasponia andersonii]